MKGKSEGKGRIDPFAKRWVDYQTNNVDEQNWASIEEA